MSSEFSVSRRSSRSAILQRFQDIEFKLAQIDPRYHPEEAWVKPTISSFTSRAQQGELFPNKEPHNQQNHWFPEIKLLKPSMRTDS